MASFYLNDQEKEIKDIPDDFKQLFLSTWKAIECGNISKFRSTLEGISAVAERYPRREINNRYFDFCLSQSVVSRHTRLRCKFFVSLMAYAAIHNQREMVELLTKRKASTWITSQETGSPLTQMMIYCLHHGCAQLIDDKMVKYMIDIIPKEKLWEQNEGNYQCNFDSNVTYHLPEKSQVWEACTPIELAIQMQRIDIAKQLVQAGANQICVTEDEDQIIPLFLEFYEFGTNHYMSWLLHEHLSQDEVSGFIEKVLEKKAMIFSDYAKKEFKDEAGRHHVHAALTCGHGTMIKKFIEHFPTTNDGQDMLKVKDSSDRTALQVAAANGDLESVSTLLKMYTGWIFENGDDEIDIARALLAAAKGKHIKVVDLILRMDDDAFQHGTRKSVLHVKLNGMETWKIAVQEGLSCIFETLRHYNQNVIAEPFDLEGNTLGHISAKSGNSNLFKVVFPLQRPLSLYRTRNADKYSMFLALVLKNHNSDTPLMVAINNNHYNILETLQERAIERELRQNAKQNKEKTEWEHFLIDHGKELLVYACSHGSIDSVKVLINITNSALGLLSPSWVENAFKESTKAGNDDVVKYFLQNFQTLISQDMKDVALLEAADFGHHRCVRVLLKHGADIIAKDDSDQNNCLMKAIERNHRETVLTILSDETFGPQSLRFVRRRSQWHAWERLKVLEYTQPLILLTKHMPEIAEWVLNKCALSRTQPRPIDSSLPHSGDHNVLREANQMEAVAVFSQQYRTEETDFGGLQHMISIEDENVQKGRDYIMSNKFELLEETDVSAYQGDADDDRQTTRIFRTINNITHPVQAMSTHNTCWYTGLVPVKAPEDYITTAMEAKKCSVAPFLTDLHDLQSKQLGTEFAEVASAFAEKYPSIVEYSRSTPFGDHLQHFAKQPPSHLMVMANVHQTFCSIAAQVDSCT